jgi:hypothetical protein
MPGAPAAVKATDDLTFGLVDVFGAIALVAFGIAAVLELPTIAQHLPRAGRPEQATFAATAAGVIAITAAFLYAYSRRHPALSRAWLGWMIAANAGVVIVKFVLSPSAFSKTTDPSLTRFLVTGLVVMLLYFAGLTAIFFAVPRATAHWPAAPKVRLAVVLAVLAVMARIAAAAVNGTTSTYLKDVARGPGLLLPVLVVAASLAVMESLQRAGTALRTAFGLTLLLVAVDHGLWVISMRHLFA